MSEDQLQAECWQWHWNTFVHERRMLFAVPNGGKRPQVWDNVRKRYWSPEGTKLKATGVVRGPADLIYIGYGFTAYIELKVGSNTQSDEQKDFEMKVRIRWQEYYLVRTFNEFKELIFKLQNRRIYGTELW